MGLKKNLGALSFSLSTIAAAQEPVSFKGNFLWLSALQYTDVSDANEINRDNKVFKIPEKALASDLRPQLRLVTPATLTIMARPRVRARLQETTIDGKALPVKGSVRSEIAEAFLQWAVSEQLTFAWGKQYYSWGASESITPSNRIFHDTALIRDVLFDVTGKHLARINLSAGSQWSLVALTEYEEAVNPQIFVAEEPFSAKAMVKAEVNWNGGSDFFGLVAGGQMIGRPWLGEYFQWNIPWLEGFSVYGDSVHERGANVWYPTERLSEVEGVGPMKLRTFAKTKIDEEKVYTLAVAGLRYDFEDSATLRFEYIRNDFGYDQDETQNAYKAFLPQEIMKTSLLDQSLPRSHQRRISARGSELPGKSYAYLSLLWPQAFKNRDLQLFARTLYSLTDYSGSHYGSAEYALGDAGVAFYAATINSGAEISELRGLSSMTHLAGYRHSW